MFGDYTLNQAYWCAEIAKLAYLKRHSEPSGLEWAGRISFSTANAAGVLVWGGDVCVLGLAGTDDLRDWLSNMDLATHSHSTLDFSRGIFLHARELAIELVQQLLLHGVDPLQGRRLFIGAHSLGAGAAVAFPFAYEEAVQGAKKYGHYLSTTECEVLHHQPLSPLSPEHIFCYDGPRVLAAESGGRYPFTTTHIRTVDDVVSDLPPRIPYLLDRMHYGRMLWITRDGKVVSSPNLLSRWLRLARLVFTGWPLRWKTMRDAHSIDRVLLALSRYAYANDWRDALHNYNLPTEETEDV